MGAYRTRAATGVFYSLSGDMARTGGNPMRRGEVRTERREDATGDPLALLAADLAFQNRRGNRRDAPHEQGTR
jgi:hypothetical protein